MVRDERPMMRTGMTNVGSTTSGCAQPGDLLIDIDCLVYGFVIARGEATLEGTMVRTTGAIEQWLPFASWCSVHRCRQ